VKNSRLTVKKQLQDGTITKTCRFGGVRKEQSWMMINSIVNFQKILCRKNRQCPMYRWKRLC